MVDIFVRKLSGSLNVALGRSLGVLNRSRAILGGSPEALHGGVQGFWSACIVVCDIGAFRIAFRTKIWLNFKKYLLGKDVHQWWVDFGGQTGEF